jgi:hypothetical protein
MFRPWREATAPPISTSVSISPSRRARARRAGGSRRRRGRRCRRARRRRPARARRPTSAGVADLGRAAHRARQLVARLELGDVVLERADPQLRAGQVLEDRDLAADLRSRPRARARRSRRAARGCRGRSSGGRRPSPPRPAAPASRAHARRDRSWRRSSCGASGGLQLLDRARAADRARVPRSASAPRASPRSTHEATDLAVDLAVPAREGRRGASFLITQLFFDNELYFDFVEARAGAGIEVPIIPGIMPITERRQIKR